MAWIENLGETVSLLEKQITGEDDFGAPEVAETWVDVSNVLVGNVTSEDAIAELNLSGKRIAYMLCIPKGDEHSWADTDVMIRGKRFRTVGLEKEYKEAGLPPLPWNKQIGVEHYE